MPIAWYGLMIEDRNDAELSVYLETTYEFKNIAKVRMTAYQQIVARSYNKNIKAKQFNVQD